MHEVDFEVIMALSQRTSMLAHLIHLVSISSTCLISQLIMAIRDSAIKLIELIIHHELGVTSEPQTPPNWGIETDSNRALWGKLNS